MPLVRSQTAHGVATVTLDSPSNRNALSTALIEELLAALAAAAGDDAVRVVVLTHTGPVFCSGADLKETAAAFGSGKPPINRLGEVLTAIWECPKPVVARLTGPARAGGLGLVAAADLAVCALEATFAFSEVRIGVIPAVISATVLPRLSSRAAAELFLTGSTFDGARAREIGLVTAAVPTDEVDAAVEAFVAALVRGAPGAVRGTKELLRRQKADTFRDELAAMTELSVSYFGSAEGIEGISAFRDKRPPNWIPDGVG
ncbi:enoyl-CoA hydratase-related protein [Dactylosporangium sp. NPDC049525]|uniref:enoyl-CoA hydratase-related protein n=1 Tax=Dactylosporangium sp. NPDC049525 TaxID=3154730 RepID=UPI0034435A75